MGWALCILPSLRSHLIRFHGVLAPSFHGAPARTS